MIVKYLREILIRVQSSTDSLWVIRATRWAPLWLE